MACFHDCEHTEANSYCAIMSGVLYILQAGHENLHEIPPSIAAGVLQSLKAPPRGLDAIFDTTLICPSGLTTVPSPVNLQPN